MASEIKKQKQNEKGKINRTKQNEKKKTYKNSSFFLC